MINTIRAVVQNVLNHWDLTDYCGGTVAATAPLTVRMGGGLLLTIADLIPVADVDTLAIGDELVLLKVLRGQKYILLAKAVTS